MELVAPAGSPDALDAAIGEGADAVYLGLENFNSRMDSANFSFAQCEGALRALRRKGKKLYVTVNTVFEQREADRMYQLLQYLAGLGPDALIVQDFGVIAMIRSCFPSLKMHASTRMNIADTRGVNALSKFGISRAALARELSLDDLKAIRAETNMELEVFVHGSLCISASGICLFSSFLGGKSANRGLCTHACRRLYKRDDPYNSSGEGTAPASGCYFSPCDLQLLQRVPDLAAAGINALKIEGRAKSAGYVGVVVSAYRLVVDALASGDEGYVRKSIAQGQEILRGDFSRPKTEYYFLGAMPDKPPMNWLNPENDDNMGAVRGSGNKQKKMHYRPVIAHNAGSRRVPGRDKAPIPDVAVAETPAAKTKSTKSGAAPKTGDSKKSGGKNKKAHGFPEGLYVAVSRIDDLYILQTMRPAMAMLSLNSKTCASLGADKCLLPFNSSEIILVLQPWFPQSASEKMAESIELLVDKGYRQFMVNNPGHLSLFRKFGDLKLIAGPWLYMFNRWAFSFFASHGFGGFVSPLENNRQNLERTATNSAERSKFFVPVFAWPPLFQIHANLGHYYDFTSFSDSRNECFSLINGADGSSVIPQTPFSITDKIPFLSEAGFKRFIIDLSGPPLRKSDYRDLMRAVGNGTPLPRSSRFNWKNGFF